MMALLEEALINVFHGNAEDLSCYKSVQLTDTEHMEVDNMDMQCGDEAAASTEYSAHRASASEVNRQDEGG